MASKAKLKEPKTYICQICGKQIISENIAKVKYCSECKTIGNVIRNARNRYGIEITVEEAKAKIAGGRKYTYESLQKPVIQECVICGKKYTTKACAKNRAKYCSRECRLLAKNTRGKHQDRKALLNENIDNIPAIKPASILGLKPSYTVCIDIRTIYNRSKEVPII